MKTIVLLNGCKEAKRKFEEIAKSNFNMVDIDFLCLKGLGHETEFVNAEESIEMFKDLEALEILVIKNYSRCLCKEVQEDYFAFEIKLVDKSEILFNDAFALDYTSENFKEEVCELIKKLAV